MYRAPTTGRKENDGQPKGCHYENRSVLADDDVGREGDDGGVPVVGKNQIA